MDCIEKSGKTVEEAIESALKELEVTRDQVEIEIVENANKGLLGIFGTKQAKVRVTIKQINPIEHAEKFMKQVFQHMGLEVEIKTEQRDNSAHINLIGDSLGILIGKHGQTLDALQYLVNLAANKVSDTRVRILLDIEDYRSRRRETLENLAMRIADKVRRRGQTYSFEPMTPQERKIIHLTLQDMADIYTCSEGEEPYRKVVVKLKK